MMSLPLVPSPTEAQKTVEKIAEEYGCISQTARRQSHQLALEAIERLQVELGESTRKLAQGPDGSISRFVFEMIQNADANSYSQAEALGEDPYIKFSIRPGIAIVEYNEDGFTHEDVRALCLIDEKKTRTNAGPNGVGFKSVFMVASKVHIQSGPFSFSFAHEPGDNGMRMIVPKWEPSGVSLAPPLTRITLTLRDSVKIPESLGEFDSPPQTLLLFVKKLRRIIFEEHLPGNWVQTLTYSCEVDRILGRCKLNELIDTPDPLVNSSASREYHIASKSVPLVDEQDGNDEAVVILAFLVKAAHTEAGKEYHGDIPSHLFSAYLPIPEVGFPFILDPYFDTQEDLKEVLKTPRNQLIFESAAEAFTDSVAQFCQDSVLQYQWTKYIPEDDKTPNPFWSELGTRIKKRVKTKAVLWPRRRNGLRLISQLRIVGQSLTDRNDQPLVPDLPDAREKYLDVGYSTELYNALPKLEALGLKTMTIHECIDRIAHDAKSPNSRMKSADDDWHERIARLLLVILEDPDNQDKSGKWIPYIKSLPLIPLAGQQWTPITHGPVFFPGSDGCQIPGDLGLRLVDSRAIGNATRMKLFAKLGVAEASADLVKSLILEKHKEKRANISLQASVKHLHYLYWASETTSLFSIGHRFRQDLPFCLFDELGLPVDDDHQLYFETQGEFNAKALLGLARQDSLPTNSNSFGSFINKEYFKSVPKPRLGTLKVPSTFEDWLRYKMQVFESPQLVETKNRSQLSPLFLYLLEKYPIKALGVLKTHLSSSYIFTFNWSPELKQQFSSVTISSTNVGERALGRTFLPLKELEARCSQFLAPIHFPFLQLPKNEENFEDWKFLREIGVGVEINIDFYLEILRQYKNRNTGFSYKIYEAIQKKVWALEETSDIIQQLRNVTTNEDLIYVPSLSGDKSLWTNSDKCFWDGPPCLTMVHTLLPALSGVNNPVITAFFVETLCIPNVSHTYLLQELELIRERSIHVNPTVNADHVREIYDYLNVMTLSLSHQQVEAVRNAFENKPLIYEPSHKKWAPTSSCVWSKDDQIPGKVTISHQYAKLKDFFVRTLKVKIHDLAMLVDELAQLVSSEHEKPLVRDVKSLIWQINDLSPSAKDLEKLKSLPIFPVNLASKPFDDPSMQAENERFSVNDREPLEAAFGWKVDLLDFELKEVRKLQPFLSCFNLESRYLSRAVTAISSLKGEVHQRQQSRELTVRLRNRAYALARCAAHFSSPRIVEDDKFIYNLFLHAEVYETDAIATTLRHTLYETVEVEVDTNKLHISETSGVLKIYVPKNQRDQDLCFLQHLPIRLFNEVLMSDDSCNSTRASSWEAIRIIAAVLESNYETISDLLDEAGIIPVPYYDIIDIDSDDEVRLAAKPAVADNVYSQIGKPTKPDAFQRDNRAPSPEAFVHPDRPIGISSNFPVSPPHRVFRPFRVESVKKEEYCQLLDNVIAVAQGKSGILPSKGPYNFDAWRDALREAEPEEDIYGYPYYSPLGFRSREQREHNLKMGAAGELYVFEVLSKLKLPSFGRGNWQSRIRHYVAAHEKYLELEEWQGQDVDMVYDDKEGVLTEILMENGHLGDTWDGARPKYWLEVKTTTRKCGARFYLTDPEYKRMESMILTEGKPSSQVYIILRVFDLDKETIGMRLYVDPASMERRGELRFTQMSGGSFSVQDIGDS